MTKLPLTNRDFKLADDRWFQITPIGIFDHPTGVKQVIDKNALESMVNRFKTEAAAPNFPGLLVDFDHFSNDPSRPTTAAGWIDDLQNRDDGLWAHIKFSDLGEKALTGGRYRLASPVWNRVDCDQWTALTFPDGHEAVHLRPRRLDRLALTNDPNLPGLAPLSNRSRAPMEGDGTAAESAAVTDGRHGGRPSSEEQPLSSRSTLSVAEPAAATPSTMNLRNEILQHLQLGGAATDAEISEALRRRADELDTLRNRCAGLQEAQAENDLECFADVITNRDIVRAQLLANRESTLALLNALRQPEPPAPLHQPRLNRPNLHLLSPVAAEPNPALARRVANRARQLQSQLKIGHHAAFRMAEGETAESDAPTAA